MPIYEYQCTKCATAFEALIRGPSDEPHCPDCGGGDLNRLLSIPAPSQNSTDSSGSDRRAQGDAAPFACRPGGCGSAMCGFE